MDFFHHRLRQLHHIPHPWLLLPAVLINEPSYLGLLLIRRDKIPGRYVRDVPRFRPGKCQQVGVSIIRMPVPVSPHGPFILTVIDGKPGQSLGGTFLDAPDFIGQDFEGGPVVFIEDKLFFHWLSFGTRGKTKPG